MVGNLIQITRKENKEMPREKEGYRDQLERLIELYPGRDTLTINETCQLLGVSRYRLMRDKAMPIKTIGKSYKIPIVALARYLSC